MDDIDLNHGKTKVTTSATTKQLKSKMNSERVLVY